MLVRRREGEGAARRGIRRARGGGGTVRTHRRQIGNLPEHGRRRFPLVAAVIGRRRLAEEQRRGSRGALRGNSLRAGDIRWWRQQQRFRRDVWADNILAEMRVEDEFPCRVDGGVEGKRWGAVHAVQVHASRVRPKAGPPKMVGGEGVGDMPQRNKQL